MSNIFSAAILSWSTYLRNTLPPMNADNDSVTFSGFSGGSWMASQVHVTNSARVAGVGLFSGGAYASLFTEDDLIAGRAKMPTTDDFDQYYTESEALSNAASFISYADNAASQGKIDALSNLNSRPVFIGANKKDPIVPVFQQYEQRDFYQNYGSNILFQKQDYGHVVPSYSEGCREYSESDKRSGAKSCGTDSVGDMFRHLLPNLPTNPQSVNARDTDWRAKGVLKKFDAKYFVDSSMLQHDGIDWDGYVYYPNTCIDSNLAVKCKIHFSLHGCNEQINGKYGWEWMERSGYMEYAASNNLIIVYPQVLFNLALFKYPCFDIMGQADKENYLFKDGIQQKAFINMIDQLIKPMDTENYNYTSWDLTLNWFYIFVSEFNRITWNFPMLAPQMIAFGLSDFVKLFTGSVGYDK